MRHLVWYIVVLSSICACASRSGPTGTSGARVQPVADVLRPGDLVRLRIWREPDLSGDFMVDETGTVTFPKIGGYEVGSESAASLKEKLVRAYQTYLVNPSIDVVILHRVNILGAVRNPGLYPVDATMTIADALAAAGGTTPEGDADKVEVVRDGRRIQLRLSQRTRLTESAIQSGDQLYVPERSWLSRNTGIITALITASVSLTIALVR